MNKPLIEKTMFVYMIRFIQRKDKDFDALVEAMEKLAPGFYCDFLPQFEYNERIVELLNILMLEPQSNGLIEYYLYEVCSSAGPDKERCVIEDHPHKDPDFPLKKYTIDTPEALYDALVDINFPATDTEMAEETEEE